MLRRTAAIVLLTLGVVSCATKSDSFTSIEQPPSGRAVIYVYRTDRITVGQYGYGPVVLVNDRPFPALRRGAYIRIVSAPGELDLRIPRNQDRRNDLGSWWADADAELRLVVEANNVYYVELNVQHNTFSFREADVVGATRALPSLQRVN